MKIHTIEYKNKLKTIREAKNLLTYNQITINEDDLLSIKAYYNADILKSVMKVLEFDYKSNIDLNTQINFKYGIKIGNNYEYVDYGNYIVYKSELQEDTKVYHITCYDKMLYSMKNYDDVFKNIDITYPITIKDYISTIANAINLEFKNQNEEFANYNRIIKSEIYKGLGYTIRDVLDELAQVTASVICINNDDKLEIRYINDTQDTIDEELLKNVNVTFGEKYGPINSIVLSRSAESDNVYKDNPESIAKNGRTEIKIVDNQIMNWNDRSDYLPDILNKLDGLEYYLNDYSSPGITYYDLYDKYNVKIGNSTYSCLMLNDETNITQGLEENIYTEMPQTSVTDYTKADKTDRKINQAYIIVDKQNNTIEATVKRIDTVEEEAIDTSNDINNLKTDINNNYTNNDDLNQKLAQQKDEITKEYTTQIKQSAENLTISITNNITANGVSKLKNSLITIDINGINVAVNTSAFNTQITNEGFYCRDSATIVAKIDRGGLLANNPKLNGKIEECGLIQKSEYTHSTFGKGLAHFYMG